MGTVGMPACMNAANLAPGRWRAAGRAPAVVNGSYGINLTVVRVKLQRTFAIQARIERRSARLGKEHSRLRMHAREISIVRREASRSDRFVAHDEHRRPHLRCFKIKIINKRLRGVSIFRLSKSRDPSVVSKASQVPSDLSLRALTTRVQRPSTETREAGK